MFGRIRPCMPKLSYIMNGTTCENDNNTRKNEQKDRQPSPLPFLQKYAKIKQAMYGSSMKLILRSDRTCECVKFD